MTHQSISKCNSHIT